MGAAAIPLVIGLGAVSLIQSERQLKEQRSAQKDALNRQAALVREAEEQQRTQASRRRSTETQENRLRAQTRARSAFSGRQGNILTQPLGALGQNGAPQGRTIIG